MKKISVIFCIITVCLSTFLFSCASNKSVPKEATSTEKIKAKKFSKEKFDEAIATGDLTKAYSFLIGRKKSNNDALVHKLDQAFLQHFMGDYEASAENLFIANNAIMDSVTKSITKGALAAIGNDNAKEYAGSIYESHYVNVFNALNYYDLGDLNNAIVQIKDLVRKQTVYENVSYAVENESDSDIANESEKAEEGKSTSESATTIGVDMQKVNSRAPKKPVASDVFSDSALERYVAVTLYKQQLYDVTAPYDVKNLAMNEISRQGKVFKLLKSDYDLDSDLTAPEGMGRITILAFSGLIGCRNEHVTYFPGDFSSDTEFLPPITINDITLPLFRLKFVYPEFTRPEKKIVKVVVTATNASGEKSQTELALLEDFDDSVTKDVNTKAYKAFKKSVYRNILKKTAAITAGAVTIKAAREASGALAANLATVAVSAAIDKTDDFEVADIRQSITLPSTANAGGINLNPGIYSINVEYYDSKDKLLYNDIIDNVIIESGKVIFRESSCIR
ncbi:MAG: hypothetical protein K6F69_03060 [Treponema sp.]|nr:hypothetical protein [Treponema sp.]